MVQMGVKEAMTNPTMNTASLLIKAGNPQPMAPAIKKSQCTVWKFHNFPITKILREINFGDFTSAKSAVFTNLEDLDFDFHGFFCNL